MGTMSEQRKVLHHFGHNTKATISHAMLDQSAHSISAANNHIPTKIENANFQSRVTKTERKKVLEELKRYSRFSSTKAA